MRRLYTFINDREPAATAGAITAAINILAIVGVFSLTTDQLAGINAAVGVILAYLVRRQVVPTVTNPQ